MTLNIIVSVPMRGFNDFNIASKDLINEIGGSFRPHAGF